MKHILLTGLLAMVVAFTSGCIVLVVGTAAGAVGGYAYVNGEIKATESTSMDKAWSATQAAMKELEFPVLNQSKDALQAQLTARNARDKKIEVKLKKLSDSVTEIRIRVGTFGDESLSRSILENITKRF